MSLLSLVEARVAAGLDPDDSGADALLSRYSTVATDAVHEHCGQVFDTITPDAPLVLDAPPGFVLLLPACQDVRTVLVGGASASVQLLTGDAHMPYTRTALFPAWTAARRLDGTGSPVPWDTDLVGPPEGAVLLDVDLGYRATGDHDHGYTVLPPAAAVQVVEMLVARLWEARAQGYGPAGGSPTVGETGQPLPVLVTPDLAALLVHLVRRGWTPPGYPVAWKGTA